MGLVTKARLMQQDESERMIERLAKHSNHHRFEGVFLYMVVLLVK